jgi:hypothetical protein
VLHGSAAGVCWPLCDAFTNDLLIRSVERHDFE